MHYIILDLEWNQANPEQSQAVQKKLGFRLQGEVIQIGAVKVNENMMIVGSFSQIVRPVHYRHIQKYISNLTHITQFMVENGKTLPHAIENFKAFCGKNPIFLTWGPDDIPMLEDNLRVHHVEYDWLHQWYDLQRIFDLQVSHDGKQKSLEYAMDYFQIPKTLQAHNALNDAQFTMLVAQHLDIKKGISTYTLKQGEFLFDTIIGNADVGEEGLKTLNEAFQEESVRHPLCPVCKVPLKRTGEQLHKKNQRYQTLFSCDEHQTFFLMVRFHKNFNNTMRARITLEQATEPTVQLYEEQLKIQAQSLKMHPARTASKKKLHIERKRPKKTVSKTKTETGSST